MHRRSWARSDQDDAVDHGRDHEEIGRRNLADVSPQGGALPGAPHELRDGRLTDVDSEFQQFAMSSLVHLNAGSLRHRSNRRADVYAKIALSFPFV